MKDNQPKRLDALSIKLQTKQKRPALDPGLTDPIQQYANQNTNGNFSKAVDILLRGALLASKMESRK